MKTILECHHRFEHLYNMLNWEKNIEFSEVNNNTLAYSNQKQIDIQLIKKFLALSLHYNLDMGIVIRYLGKKYTG